MSSNTVNSLIIFFYREFEFTNYIIFLHFIHRNNFFNNRTSGMILHYTFYPYYPYTYAWQHGISHGLSSAEPSASQFMIMAAPVKKRDVQRNFEDRSSDDDDHNSSNSEDNEKESLEEQVRNLSQTNQCKTSLVNLNLIFEHAVMDLILF